jgi:hypothetical protein
MNYLYAISGLLYSCIPCMHNFLFNWSFITLLIMCAVCCLLLTCPFNKLCLSRCKTSYASWSHTRWSRSLLTWKAFENFDANIELFQSICRKVLHRCELCTGHGGPHFEKKKIVNSVSNKEISNVFNVHFTNQLTDFSAALYYSIINVSLLTCSHDQICLIHVQTICLLPTSRPFILKCISDHVLDVRSNLFFIRKHANFQ